MLGLYASAHDARFNSTWFFNTRSHTGLVGMLFVWWRAVREEGSGTRQISQVRERRLGMFATFSGLSSARAPPQEALDGVFGVTEDCCPPSDTAR